VGPRVDRQWQGAQRRRHQQQWQQLRRRPLRWRGCVWNALLAGVTHERFAARLGSVSQPSPMGAAVPSKRMKCAIHTGTLLLHISCMSAAAR
jgi:hypothetical protein